MSLGRLARTTGAALALLVLFPVACAAGVLLHVNTPTGRDLVMRQVNALFASSFRGHLVIRGVGHVGPSGVSGVNVTLDDAEGRRIAAAQGARAEISAPALARSALLDRSHPVQIDVRAASIESAELAIDDTQDGELRLGSAFQPLHPSPPPEAGAPPGRGLQLSLRRVWVKHTVVHEALPGAPAREVIVDDLDAAIDVRPQAIELGLAGARVGVPDLVEDQGLAGTLRGHVVFPSASGESMDVRVDWDGSLGGARQTLFFTMTRDVLVARCDADLPPVDARALWPASGLDSPAHLHLEASGPLAHLDVAARAAAGEASLDLDGHLRVGPHLGGDLTVRGRGIDPRAFVPGAPRARIDLAAWASVAGDATASLAAHLHADVERLQRPPVSVGHATVDARAWGRLDDPRFAIAVDAGDVAAGSSRFDRLVAETDVALTRGLTLLRPRARIETSGLQPSVRAERVELRDGGVTVDGARVEGLGAPLTARVEASPQNISIRAKSDGIDLPSVARLAHLESTLRAGRLALDSDLRLSGARATGRLQVQASGVDLDGGHGLSGRVDLTFGGRTFKGEAHVDAPGVGRLDATAPEIRLDGSGPLRESGWRMASGEVDVDARVDLARLAAMVPADRMPVSDARGTVTVRARAQRDGATDLIPALSVQVTTQGLGFEPRTQLALDMQGHWIHPAAPWRFEGVDIAAEGTLDGGSAAAHLAVDLRDVRGLLAHVDAATLRLPCEELFHDPGRFETRLLGTDARVAIDVPERKLQELPAFLAPRSVTGRARVRVRFTGTARRPTIDVGATLGRAGFAGAKLASPVDLVLSGHYDGRTGTVNVSTSGDRRMLTLDANLQAAAADLIRAGSRAPWKLGARAHLDAFPLQTIGALDDRGIAGQASGDVSLADLHDDARVRADLRVDALSVGSVSYRSAEISLTADGHAVDARARVEPEDGFGEIRAHAAASWGAAVAPTLDPTQPLRLTLASHNLRIAGLAPLVEGTLEELDGRLDASARAELDPRSRTARLDGTLALTRGTVEAEVGGGELHDVTADVKFSPDGTIALEKLTASGARGRLQAVGSARMQGLALRAAHVTLTIPSAIPVTASGVEIGDVDGRIDLTASATPAGTRLAVDVPRLGVKLPEGATGNPESLSDMKNVRVGVHRAGTSEFVLVPLDPPKQTAQKSPGESARGGAAVTARLHDVHVVKGTQLQADLSGNVQTKGSSVTGQIRLSRGGKLQVQGRTFTIDSGTVSFVGDPGNPQVVVKARWRAPDGTAVVASFDGPLKSGKVTLSSEPPMPRDDIVQLLLFGSADGKQAQTPGASTENTAIATAGGEAAQPLNHMLGQLGLGAVTTKIDTSQAANPKPEVEVQIARDVSVQLAVVLGQPLPGVNPDRTLVTLDWRFMTRWSLTTTVGDAGSTIFDLLWEKRY
jgi:translocation and assembly module TamB